MTDDDSIPRPTSAAWLPSGGTDDRVIVQWIAEEADEAAYLRRALFIHRSGDLDMQSDAVQQYAANNNVGSARNPHVDRGGAVLAFRTDVRLLGKAVAAAKGQVLGVVEHVPGEMAGWAAATGALDLTTGEPTPVVPEDIHEALEDLHAAGYQGYHKDRDPYNAAHYFPPIDVLLATGYEYPFVAGYLVALGAHGERVGDDLKRIYVPKDQRRNVSRK